MSTRESASRRWFITGLDYSNPQLSPFDEFQRYKHHPIITTHLTGGERICYDARTPTKGGPQARVKGGFPGGLLIGDNLGTLNNGKYRALFITNPFSAIALLKFMKLLNMTEIQKLANNTQTGCTVKHVASSNQSKYYLDHT